MTHAKLAVFSLFAIVALAAVFIIGKPLARKIDGTDAAYRTQVALEVDNQRFTQNLEQQKMQASAPASVMLAYILVAGLSVAISLAAMVTYSRLYKSPLVRADANGRLPIARRVLADVAPTNEQALLIIMASMEQATAIQLETARAMARIADKVDYKITVGESRAPMNPQPMLPPPPMLAELPALMLPDNIGLSDVIHRVSPNHIAVGVLANGDILEMPLRGAYHGLQAGDTRTGKSNAIDAMVTQIHHMAARGMAVKLFACDYKRELKATWNRSPLFAGGIESDASGVIDILDYLVNGSDGILHRQDCFARVGTEQNRIIRNVGDYEQVTGERMPVNILFIDEINALLESSSGKQGAELESLLKITLQTGAASGIYVQGGAQYLSAAVMGRDSSKQFVSRSLYGQWDTTAVNMMFGNVKTIDESTRRLITGGKGRGLVRTVSSGGVVPFQSLRCDEADILQAIHVAGNCQPLTRSIDSHFCPSGRAESIVVRPLVNVTEIPTITLETPHIGIDSVNSGNVANVSELERVQIIALAKAGISRSAICKQLFGSVNGREYAKIKIVLGEVAV